MQPAPYLPACHLNTGQHKHNKHKQCDERFAPANDSNDLTNTGNELQSNYRPPPKDIILDNNSCLACLHLFPPCIHRQDHHCTIMSSLGNGSDEHDRDRDDTASPNQPPNKIRRTRVARACENCRARRIKCAPPYPCQSCRDAGLTNCYVRDKARPMRLVCILIWD